MHITDMIARAAAGEQNALEHLIAGYRREAQMWARDIVQDTHLAEDVVLWIRVSIF